MTMELYGWLVPLGALVLAGAGVLFVHVSTRRLEAKMQATSKRRHSPAE